MLSAVLRHRHPIYEPRQLSPEEQAQKAEAERKAEENWNQHEAELKRTAWKREDNSATAYKMAKDFVKDRLLTPGVAQWPEASKTNVQRDVQSLSDQRYEVNSWVDSQNSFGALLRKKYRCVVKQVSADEWTLESFRMDP